MFLLDSRPFCDGLGLRRVEGATATPHKEVRNTRTTKACRDKSIIWKPSRSPFVDRYPFTVGPNSTIKNLFWELLDTKNLILSFESHQFFLKCDLKVTKNFIFVTWKS